MTEKTDKIAALLLAAGGSSRMGRSKQLLVYEGETLLRRAAETLLSTICSCVIVILGAEFERTRQEINDLPVDIVHNEGWRTGMSSSIRVGLSRLLQAQPDTMAVIIMLCDQPNVTASHIDMLAHEFFDSGCDIVAAEYSRTVGAPALFARKYFNDLLNIEGDKGARKLIRSESANLSTVQMPEAAFDIDTLKDLVSQKS
jgi:molybdenum cofactor cytidylyltransferase